MINEKIEKSYKIEKVQRGPSLPRPHFQTPFLFPLFPLYLCPSRASFPLPRVYFTCFPSSSSHSLAPLSFVSFPLLLLPCRIAFSPPPPPPLLVLIIASPPLPPTPHRPPRLIVSASHNVLGHLPGSLLSQR